MQGRTETLKPLTAAIASLEPLNPPSPTPFLWWLKAIRGQAGGELKTMCCASFLAVIKASNIPDLHAPIAA